MIKKYSISIIILVVALAGISLFYGEKAITVSQFPNYYLKTETGDSTAVKNVTLKGMYSGRQSEEMVSVTPAGSVYKRKLPLLEQLDNFTAQPRVDDLRKRYRDFMRGEHSYSEIYEDEKWLVSAATTVSKEAERKPIPMKFKVYSKKAKDTLHFQIELPADKKDPDYYVDVYNVQRIQDDIKVVTRNVSGQTETYHLYTVSIKDRKLLKDKKVFNRNTSNSEITYSSAEETNSFAPSRYTVISTIKYEPETLSDGTQNLKEVSKNFFAIDMQSGSVMEVPLPKGMNHELVQIFTEDEKVYFTEKKDGKLRVVTYNLESAEIQGDLTLPDNDIMTISKNCVYLANSGMDRKTIHLFIYDLSSGENIYKGSFVPKDKPAENGKYLYATNLIIL